MILDILNSSDALFYNKQTLALQTFADYTNNPAGFVVKKKNKKHSFFVKMTVEDFNTDNTDNHQGSYLILNSGVSDTQYNEIKDKKVNTIIKSFNSILKGMNAHIINHHMNSINRYELLISDQVERDKSLYKLAKEYIADGSNANVIGNYATLHGISEEDFCNTFITQYDFMDNKINTGLSVINYIKNVFIKQVESGTIKEVTGLSFMMRSKIGDYEAMMTDCNTLLSNNPIVEVLPAIADMRTTIGG